MPVEGTSSAATPLMCGSRARISSTGVRRLQKILGVVDAGVVHAAIARAGCHTDFRKLFDKKTVLPAPGNSACDGATDDATANNQNVGLVHALRISKSEKGK